MLSTIVCNPGLALTSLAIRDAFLVLGILIVLVMSIFLLTLFIKERDGQSASRNSRRRRRTSKRTAQPETVSPDRESDSEQEEVENIDDPEDPIRVKETVYSEDGTKRRRKFRKRRKDHRPTNPTLAETGGLPPARTDGSEDSVN